MEYLTLLLALLLVDLLAAASPGPNFLLVTHRAASGDRRDALLAVCGIAAANLVWCSAVVGGLAALFEAWPTLYRALKIGGGIYLLWLGVQLWRAPVALPEPAALSGRSTTRALLDGFLTNLSNPKSLVYFGSVFALFLRPGTPLIVQLLSVAVVIANTFAWYGSVALAFSHDRIRHVYRLHARRVSRVAGVLLGAFGARLLLARE